MTENQSGTVADAVPADAGGDGGADSVAKVRRQRDEALRAGDRDLARHYDELEREIYDDAERKSAGGEGAPAAAVEQGAAPLTGEEVTGVLGALDEIDPDGTSSLRREWGGEAAANLGYAHLWFTTKYTQEERDSMVITPDLIAMGARMGRKLAAERRAGKAEKASGDEAGDPVEIRKLKTEALRKGDYRLAQKYDEQERAAYARMHGEGPIVGHAGRKL